MVRAAPGLKAHYALPMRQWQVTELKMASVPPLKKPGSIRGSRSRIALPHGEAEVPSAMVSCPAALCCRLERPASDIRRAKHVSGRAPATTFFLLLPPRFRDLVQENGEAKYGPRGSF
jgi:hypothetical protein